LREEGCAESPENTSSVIAEAQRIFIDSTFQPSLYHSDYIFKIVGGLLDEKKAYSLTLAPAESYIPALIVFSASDLAL
jgi:hypothetical protein